MCEHQPRCPDALAPDRMAAHVVVSHPEQGWSLLCNGIVGFDDAGALLPDGRALDPHADGRRGACSSRLPDGGRRRIQDPPAPAWLRAGHRRNQRLRPGAPPGADRGPGPRRHPPAAHHPARGTPALPPEAPDGHQQRNEKDTVQHRSHPPHPPRTGHARGARLGGAAHRAGLRPCLDPPDPAGMAADWPVGHGRADRLGADHQRDGRLAVRWTVPSSG